MLRLLKYLKPYLLHLLLAVVLLFVQANADLALPDYMSRIVNVGIQQDGVENAVPVALRVGTLDRLTVLLSAEDQEAVRGAYTLVDAGSADYERYLQDYPLLESEPLYVRRDLGQDEIERLNPVLGRAFLAAAGIQQLLADPAKAAAMGQALGVDLADLPPGTDIYTLLRELPAAQRAQIAAAMNRQFAALGDSMIVQSAVAQVKAEYAALGLDSARLQSRYIVNTGVVMLLITLLSVVCTVAVGFLAARTAAGLARDLRRSVFTRVEDFSNEEFGKFSTASLITRSTNDVVQVQMVVIMMVRMVFYAPIIGVGGIIRAIGKSSSMWWLIALAVLVLLGVIMVVFAIALPRFKRIQVLIDRLNLVMRENLTGMMVIRAFNRQEFELERFDRANKDVTGIMLFVTRIMVVVMPLIMLIMNALSLLIIWFGARQVAASTMQVGDMMAFLQYAIQIVFAFLTLSFMFIILPRAAVSAGRIADVLETAPAIKDPALPQPFPTPFDATIEFRNVTFRYPDAEEDVLHDISFVARPGQTTAFIGSTGSGKSTVVNLIPRFYNATCGSILVGGMDICAVAQRDLRDRIGYIPQRGTLFSGTVGSNLRYADEGASDDALHEAAAIAQAAEFITANEAGLEAEVAQGGMNLSGGQKQRLAIARALVKKPPIFIFDDSFSALDFRTDVALRKALKEKLAGSTVLIVTQRVSTILHAEQIIVLDEGRIVGRGTHAELLRDCEVYREIALSQIGKEGLA